MTDWFLVFEEKFETAQVQRHLLLWQQQDHVRMEQAQSARTRGFLNLHTCAASRSFFKFQLLGAGGEGGGEHASPGDQYLRLVARSVSSDAAGLYPSFNPSLNNK